jgi:hypothetical protein
VEPPAYLNVLILAQEIFEYCFGLAAAVLDHPELEKGLAVIPLLPQADADELGEAGWTIPCRVIEGPGNASAAAPAPSVNGRPRRRSHHQRSTI